MKIYLIAGVELHQSMADVLENNGYHLAGYEYTIDAAVTALKSKPINADLFIVNGLALVSGFSEGEINRNQSMLIKLTEMRMSAPQIRILLLLPKQNPAELIMNILSLGIYDIRQVSSFNGTELVDWINNPMNIADFQNFKTGKTPDCPPGGIKYINVPEEYERRQPVPEVPAVIEISKRTKDVAKKKKNIEPPYKELLNKRISLMLCVGDDRIESWVKENFSHQVDVAVTNEFTDLRAHIEETLPDICMVMHLRHVGGVSDADDLAVWAVNRVKALIFIIGELDVQGKEMLDKVTKAGVRNVISCEKGGFISGDELTYTINGVIREIQGSSLLNTDKVVQTAKCSNSTNAEDSSIVTKLFKPKTNKSKTKRKTNKSGTGMFKGLSLEEDSRFPVKTGTKSPIGIFPGGIFIIVSPWRPNMAGRLAAQAVTLFSEVEGGVVAYIGASRDSTGALWLNVPDEDLVLSDWRVPGSMFPIEQDNMQIFAVDPSKNLDLESEEQLWQIVRQTKINSTYTVVDFAGDILMAQKALLEYRGAVTLVVLPGGDPVECKIALLWYKNFCEGKENVVAGIDLRGSVEGIPEGVEFKVIIRNNPADAFINVLKRSNNEEFIWI